MVLFWVPYLVWHQRNDEFPGPLSTLTEPVWRNNAALGWILCFVRFWVACAVFNDGLVQVMETAASLGLGYVPSWLVDEQRLRLVGVFLLFL